MADIHVSAIESSSVFDAPACNWTTAFLSKNASCVQLSSIELDNNKGYFECLVRPIGAYRTLICGLLARNRKRGGATRITNGINVLILHGQKWLQAFYKAEFAWNEWRGRRFRPSYSDVFGFGVSGSVEVSKCNIDLDKQVNHHQSVCCHRDV